MYAAWTVPCPSSVPSSSERPERGTRGGVGDRPGQGLPVHAPAHPLNLGRSQGWPPSVVKRQTLEQSRVCSGQESTDSGVGEARGEVSQPVLAGVGVGAAGGRGAVGETLDREHERSREDTAGRRPITRASTGSPQLGAPTAGEPCAPLLAAGGLAQGGRRQEGKDMKVPLLCVASM